MASETATVGFKTRIHLNNKQSSTFKTWSTARKRAFNFALNLCDIYLERIAILGKKNNLIKEINHFDRYFNASKYPLGFVKKCKGGGLIGTGLNTWIRDENVPSSACQIAIKYDLKNAWSRCFKKLSRQPKYQGKGRKDSFTLSSADLKPTFINGKYLKLPKSLGTVTLGDPIPYSEYKLGNTAFSCEGDKWYVSFTLTVPAAQYYKQLEKRERIVGVDLGMKIYAAESTGKTYFAPEKLDRLEQRKSRINHKIGVTIHKNLMLTVSGCERCCQLVKSIADKKRLCRKCQEVFYPHMRSRRIKKLRASIARISAKQTDIRNNMSHQLTTDLVKRFEIIAIENLKVANMTKSSKGNAEKHGEMVKQKAGLNRVILNVSPHRVRQMLEYKTAKCGGSVIAVNPAYTSQCPKCDSVSKENRRTQVTFQCVECGYIANADTNAAENIKQRGIETLASRAD
ncbi:TPA: RNA-guided endonuclease InsQ/TnpB family protein [Photobacterium damselae]